MTVENEKNFDVDVIPQHVGIIMDGNGRWAQLQGKSRVVGHKKGVESVRTAVKLCRERNIKALTLFAFSSENWKRPNSEVSVLMDLFMYVLTREVKRLNKYDIKFKLIGDTSRFSKKLQQKINDAIELTAGNSGLILSIAANYGGRWDIANAAKVIAKKVVDKEISIDDIDEHCVDQYTSLYGLPELDLLIRTGGDYRISNFLLWQSAYAEFYFTDTLWPDFTTDALSKALSAFKQRERRYGKTGDQVKK